MCSAEGGAQLLLCPGCVCSGRKAVCGEALGSHPQGDGICELSSWELEEVG